MSEETAAVKLATEERKEPISVAQSTAGCKESLLCIASGSRRKNH